MKDGEWNNSMGSFMDGTTDSPKTDGDRLMWLHSHQTQWPQSGVPWSSHTIVQLNILHRT